MLPLKTLFTGKKPNGLPSGLPKFGANLANASLRGLNLVSESLPGADFFYADLSNSNLANANLEQAYFVKANLTGVDLSGANLKGANFRSVDLSKTILTNANLKRAVFDHHTKLPFSKEEAIKQGMIESNEYTSLPEVN